MEKGHKCSDWLLVTSWWLLATGYWLRVEDRVRAEMKADPSDWVVDHISEIRPEGQVLDLACGSGRHTRLLLEKGFEVTALDINTTRLSDLKSHPRLTIVEVDLEDNSASAEEWPLTTQFDGIVVTNYLHRPLFRHLSDSLSKDGILIYETFMIGNERFGKPSNPDFLLKKDELRNSFGETLRIIEFSQGYLEVPKPAMIQQFCGKKVPN